VTNRWLRPSTVYIKFS